MFFRGEPPLHVSSPPSVLSHCPIFISSLPHILPPFISLCLSSPSLSAEAHQGKQMLWLLFMFPLGLAFIQIIHRPCTVQTLSLTGLHWQLSQPHPRSDRTKRGGVGGLREWTIATHWWAPITERTSEPVATICSTHAGEEKLGKVPSRHRIGGDASQDEIERIIPVGHTWNTCFQLKGNGKGFILSMFIFFSKQTTGCRGFVFTAAVLKI